jgi:multidrug efflux pump subunit AcrA (membrane-fusion protein)
MMSNITTQLEPEPLITQPSGKPGVKLWLGAAAVTAVVAGAIVFGPRLAARSAVQSANPSAAVVTVSVPLEKDLSARLQFLGQYSAVDRVELRAQVGGALTQIGFKDGDIVHKGDFLFEIDPTPYQIKLSEATAQLASAHARLDLASQELTRAETLKRTDAGTSENVEQRAAEQRTAQAAVDNAEALVRDARFASLTKARSTSSITRSIGRAGLYMRGPRCRMPTSF